MIIEIGTSDFRTQAGKVDGLFVEPIKEYFDRLPNCLKENVAVSNNEGEIDIYYIPSKRIKELGLPDNSVNEPHKTIVEMGWMQHLEVDRVPVVRIKTLLDKHGIQKIDLLKIDTEGHDTIILNDFLDTCDILPSKIQFESNVLSSFYDVMKAVERLSNLGYKCTQVKFDMVCEL
jgi:FkbM family methyltransferase